MSESYKNVMPASQPGQGEKSKTVPMKGSSQSDPHRGEVSMPMTQYANVKPSAIAENGRLLVFAPPLMMGFRGCPLALSNGKVSVKTKSGIKRNWAKRRAFGH
jgi:hypothetical protein